MVTPEKRHQQPGRRSSDADAYGGAAAIEVIDEDVRAIAVAIQRVQRGWKKWAAFCAAVAAVVSATVGLMTWLGWTNLSPDDRFRQHDTMMRSTIGSVQSEVDSLKSRVGNIEEAVDLMSYLLCVQIRRTDPAALPPKCNDTTIRNLAPRTPR